MLIVCPRCDSSFEIDSSLLEPEGRRLECSECQHSWFCGLDGLPREGLSMANEAEERDEASSVADSLGGIASVEDRGTSAERDSTEGGSAEGGFAESDSDESDSDDRVAEFSEESAVLDDVSKSEADVNDLFLQGVDEEENKVEGELETEDSTDGISRGSEEEGVSDVEEDIDEDDSIREHERRIKRRKKGFRGGRGRGEGVWGWLLLLVVMGGLAWGGYRYMSEVISYYPPAASIYQQLGLLRPLGEGLRILPARTETIENDDGQKTLLVVGEIFNTLSGPQDIFEVPLLRGALIDSNEREVRVWTFRAEEERILPNERITYRTEIGDPPTNVRALKITFARVSEGLN